MTLLNKTKDQPEFADNGGALRSPWKMAWKKLRRHKLALAGMWVLILLHIFAIFADFFAPYSELTTDRRRTYHPPARVHIFHGQAGGPFVSRTSGWTARNIYEDTSTMYPIYFFMRRQV